MAEYVVTVKKDANWEELKTELTTDTSADASVDSAVIPDREVTVTALRPSNKRNTVYDLTDSEAEALRNDDRIISVSKSVITPHVEASLIQEGQDASSFNKNDSYTGNHDNWGLLRHISKTNNFGTSRNDPGGSYDYVLDGTGVDVVIMDTGIQADHPEWEDADGNTRLQQIDWSTTSTTNYPAPQDGNTYRDFTGHGTHVASTIAGKTFGWAKNARIYSIPVIDNPDANIPMWFNTPTAFDVVRDWHNSKSGADAGRPTVVNMSFGFNWKYDTQNSNPNDIFGIGDYDLGNFVGGVYRGASHTLTDRDPMNSRGIGYNPDKIITQHPNHVAEVDADIEQMIKDGIHVVVAAGNSWSKHDYIGGNDWDNYLTTNNLSVGGVDLGSMRVYYNRGGSPSGIECGDTIHDHNTYGTVPSGTDNGAICVGNLDSRSHSGTLDRKVNSSNSGPGVDIYAAGTDIIGAWINTSGSTYSKNSSYKQLRATGTSMAAPQIAGMIACLLQAHPDWSPATVKKWLLDNAENKIHTTGADNDYGEPNTLHGGTQRVAYFPLNGSRPFTWSSS